MRPGIGGIVGLIAMAGGLGTFIYASASGIGINPLYWLLAVGVGYLIYRRDILIAALQRVRHGKPASREDTSETDFFSDSHDHGPS